MKLFLMSAVALSLSVGCTSSGEIPFEDVEIVAVAGQTSYVQVFFRVQDGDPCAGVLVEKSGSENSLTFLKEQPSSSGSLFFVAVKNDEGAFADSLLVEIPVPPELQLPGREFYLSFSGDTTTRYTSRVLPDHP